LPKVEALDFILANEKHDRGYYTGFLGPINIEGKSQVFVNLRCLQLFDSQFVLYSGAGITASSVAEKEWDETDNKMMTMMNVMMTPNPSR
jgi:isochorismate synthase